MAIKVNKKPAQQLETQSKPIPKSKQNLKPSVTPQHKGDVFLTDAQKATVHLLAVVTKQINDLDASALIKEKEGYRKTLVALCTDMPASQKVTMITDEATVVFSEAPDVRVVEDMNGLIGLLKDKIGYDGLMQLLKITVGDAEKYLSPAELEPFLKTKPGSRQLKSATLNNQE